MSTLKTDNIVNVAGNGPPTLTNGVNVTGTVAATTVTATTVTATGVVTGSSFAGSGANLTGISSEPFKPVSLAGATYVVTVASVDSVNKFHIAGVSNPTLNFSKANVYIFDLSDSSNAGHPLVFKTSGSVAYTTGVVVTGTAGQAGAKVTITVAASAPLALLYSCSAHGNAMGNTIAVAASGAMDVGTFNFFDNGTVSGANTVSFTNIPTQARWKYSARTVGSAAYALQGIVYQNQTYADPVTANNMRWKPDGTRAFYGSSDGKVHQVDFSTAWDFTTASYSSVTAQTTLSQTYAFGVNADGTSVYVGEWNNGGGAYRQFNLGTAWDLSTFSNSLVSDKNFASLSSDCYYLRNLYFKPDGLVGYIPANGKLFQFNFSTAFLLSTASYATKISSIAGGETTPQTVTFNPDGTKMFVAGQSTGTVYQYTLSTGYNISTATYDSVSFNPTQGNSNINEITFAPNAEYLILKTGGLWKYTTTDMSGTSITFPSSVQTAPSATLVSNKRATYDFFTLDGGTTVNLIGEEIV
jgi:hypothetical protein